MVFDFSVGVKRGGLAVGGFCLTVVAGCGAVQAVPGPVDTHHIGQAARSDGADATPDGSDGADATPAAVRRRASGTDVVLESEVLSVPLDGVLLGGVKAKPRTDIAMFVSSLTHNELPAFSGAHEEAVAGLMTSVVGSTTARNVVVSPMIVAAGPDVVGVRYTLTQFPKEGQSQAFRTVWTDARSGHAVSLGSLWRGGSAEDFVWSLVDRAAVRGGASPGAVEAVRGDQSLTSVEFMPGTGDLVVRFASGSLGHEDAQARAVVLPAAVVSRWLSSRGWAAQRASVSPQGVAGQRVMDHPEAPAVRQIDCAVEKCVALTFDDGPGPFTPQLLDTLKDKEVPATFFVLGSLGMVDSNTVRRAVAEGHEVSNHTWSHPLLTHLTRPQAVKQVEDANAALKQITGVRPTLFRPPYGGRNATLDGAIEHPTVLWSVDTNDWRDQEPGKVLGEVKRAVRPGSIVLMHDIHASTVASIPAVVDYLKGEGYTLVTVSEMFSDTGMENHKVYSKRP